MFDRLSENCIRMMKNARAAAVRQRHAAIEPEHMLIGILQVTDSNAAQMLQRIGVDAQILLEALTSMLPTGDAAATPPAQLPFTPASKRVLMNAFELATELQHEHVGSHHLLLGIMKDDNTASQIMQRVGADAERLQAALADIPPLVERNKTRLLLVSNSTMHGGGYLEHCRGEIEQFLGDRKRVLFVPFALHDHDGYTAKARTAFEAMGHELTGLHQADDKQAAVATADAVFIGGGNTFRLLNALYHFEVLGAIQQRALAGMPYIGSSAGTNVATLSIRTTNDMPIVHPPSFAALRLVPFQINPHYLDPDPGSSHMGETREERIVQFHEEHSVPVLGLREGCMLRVTGKRMELRGTTDARLFRKGEEAVEFAPGSDLSFLLET